MGGQIGNCKPSSASRRKISCDYKKKSKKRKLNQHRRYKCHYLNEERKKRLGENCSGSENSEDSEPEVCKTKRNLSCKPKKRKTKCRTTKRLTTSRRGKKPKKRSAMRKVGRKPHKLLGNRHPGCTRKRCDC